MPLRSVSRTAARHLGHDASRSTRLHEQLLLRRHRNGSVEHDGRGHRFSRRQVELTGQRGHHPHQPAKTEQADPLRKPLHRQ